MPSPPDKDPIDAYLDDVCAQFTFMPDAEIARTRLELRQHIEAMVDEIVTVEGETREAAARTALVRFGDPRTVGKRIADASPFYWYRARAKDGRPLWLRRVDRIRWWTCICLVLFGAWIRDARHIPAGIVFYIVAMAGSGLVNQMITWIKDLYDQEPSIALHIERSAIPATHLRAKLWYAFMIARHGVALAARDKSRIKKELTMSVWQGPLMVGFFVLLDLYTHSCLYIFVACFWIANCLANLIALNTRPLPIQSTAAE